MSEWTIKRNLDARLPRSTRHYSLTNIGYIWKQECDIKICIAIPEFEKASIRGIFEDNKRLCSYGTE